MTIRGAKCSKCRLTFIGDLGQPFSCLSCGTRLKVYREKTRPLDAAGQSISCSLSVTIENTLPPVFLRGKNNSLFAGSCTGVLKVGDGGSGGRSCLPVGRAVPLWGWSLGRLGRCGEVIGWMRGRIRCRRGRAVGAMSKGVLGRGLRRVVGAVGRSVRRLNRAVGKIGGSGGVAGFLRDAVICASQITTST